MARTRVVPLRIPENLDELAAISAQTQHTDKATALRQWIYQGAANYVLRLVAEGRVSIGRGAELLDLTVHDLNGLAETLGIELGASDAQRRQSRALATKFAEDAPPTPPSIGTAEAPQGPRAGEDQHVETGTDAAMPALNGSSTRRQRTSERLAKLARDFDLYLSAFDQAPLFSGDQLAVHLDAIESRRTFGTLSDALDNSAFLLKVRHVLISWGLGTRGSKLAGPGDFIAALRGARPTLVALDGAKIDDQILDPQIVDKISNLIGTLAIAENKSRIVPVTKALHHLLPDLVPPMDREYTLQRFFGRHPIEIQSHPEACFRVAFDGLRSVATAVTLGQLVGPRWRSSPSKLLDNALVGYCRTEKIPKTK